MGNLYRKRGNIKKAIMYYQKAFDKDSTNVYTLYDYSGILNDFNLDSKKPEQFLKKAIEIEPFYSKGYAKYADYLRRYPKNEESLKRADSLYQFAIANDPYYPWAYAGRGWLFHKNNDRENALQSFKDGINNNPNKPTPYNYLGYFYKSAIKDNSKAEENFKKAIDKDSFYTPAYENLVDLYNKDNRHQESITLINTLFKWNSDSPVLYTLLGDTYFDLNDFETAAQKYQLAIDMDSTFAKGYSNLAFCLLKTGKYTTAVENYKKAFQNNPYQNSLESFSKLLLSEARKQKRNKDYTKQKLLLELSYTMISNNETAFALGQFYYFNDKPQKAQQTINSHLVQIESKSWKIKYLELATKIEIDLKNKKNAKLYVEALNKINPRPNSLLNALVLKLDGKTKRLRRC